MKIIFSVLLPVFVLVTSCAPKIHKTFGFDKLLSVNELSGTYSGVSSVSLRHHRSFNVLSSFFIEDEMADLFTISFLGSNTLTLDYTIKDGENVKNEKLLITGKKVRNAFQIDLKKNEFFIPFLGGKSNLNLISIGKNTKGDLIIENYMQQSGAILHVQFGQYYKDIRVFKKAEPPISVSLKEEIK